MAKPLCARVAVLLGGPLLPALLLACTPDELPPSGTESTGSATEAMLTSSAISGDGTNYGSGATADGTGEPTIDVSGDAFAFTLPGEPYGLIDGATISVLEQPAQSVMSDALGHFELGSLPPGGTATFVLERVGFPTAHTKTFTLPQEGVLEQVTFQVPADDLFALLADLLMLEVDPTACQMVSTVTRVGKSIYDEGAHGEAGATVTIDPPLPPEHGPIYFNAAVIPDPSLTETSDDGGILFTNVPPGAYVLSAHKDGVTFESVTMQCEPGVLVNASPPYGLQAL